MVQNMDKVYELLVIDYTQAAALATSCQLGL